VGLKHRSGDRKADYCIAQRRALYAKRHAEAIDFSVFIRAIRTSRGQTRQVPGYFLPILFGTIAMIRKFDGSGAANRGIRGNPFP
jgi:hypothetical protein